MKNVNTDKRLKMPLQRFYMFQFLLIFYYRLILSLAPIEKEAEVCFDEALGKCHCSDVHVDCALLGGAVHVIHLKRWRDSYVTIKCNEEPSDINALLEKVPNLNLHNVTEFDLTNCLKLPNILSRNSVNYKGTILFEKPAVPHNFFWQSNGLQKLQLHFAYAIETLPSQLFRSLTELKILSVTIENAVEDFINVPAQIFSTLSNLQMLQFQINNPWFEYNITLKNFTSEHLKNVLLLQQLDFAGNNMQTLPEDIFSALSELSYLDLQGNKLRSLSRNLLAAQHKLTILDLSYNLLAHIPTGFFAHTTRLWKLLLRHNFLSSPSNIIGNLRSLRYLHHLDLGENLFETISGNGSYANETIVSIFSHSNGRTSQRLVENLGNLGNIFNLSVELSKEKRNLVSIDLMDNALTHFSMDWITAAGLACPFRIDLRHNEIKHVYALTPLMFSTSPMCRVEILLAENPIVCDCKLAWVYSGHYLTNVIFAECSATNNSNQSTLLSDLDYSAFCSWQPAFCPNKCICALDAALLRINCTDAELNTIAQLPRPSQFSLKSSTLSIRHNRFYELPSHTTFGYANVTQINASYNEITVIVPSQLPPNLTVLDVSNNRLEHLRDDFLLAWLEKSQTLKELYLARNPWRCDCSAERLLQVIQAHHARIPDVAQLRCANYANKRLIDVDFDVICTSGTLYKNFTLISTLAIAVFVLISLIAFFHKYQLELNGHKMFLCFINESELDNDKTFDAFISYAHQEELFVNHKLLPQLEHGDPPFRICTHERNWLAGAYIPEQIVESVTQSRRTIIILSQHFIESDWGRMEFRTAHQCSLSERRARIIIVKYGKITNIELLDKELRSYLAMNTHLDWADVRFWSKLRYAMPHKKGEVRNAEMLELNERVYVIGQVELNQ